MNPREFKTELGKLVMRALADNTHPDDILAVLKDQVMEELRLQESRKAMQRQY